MLLLKIVSLSKGYSSVQLETVERLVEMFNKGVIPVVFQQGSLGASGDLAPLAHLSLPLIGEGKVFFGGKINFSREICFSSIFTQNPFLNSKHSNSSSKPLFLDLQPHLRALPDMLSREGKAAGNGAIHAPAGLASAIRRQATRNAQVHAFHASRGRVDTSAVANFSFTKA